MTYILPGEGTIECRGSARALYHSACAFIIIRISTVNTVIVVEQHTQQNESPEESQEPADRDARRERDAQPFGRYPSSIICIPLAVVCTYT